MAQGCPVRMGSLRHDYAWRRRQRGVFELTPNTAKTARTETALHSFCDRGGNCIDGASLRNVVMDGAGDLCGAT